MKSARTFSVYLSLRDGIRLAADVNLPANLGPSECAPVVLMQTRYWRSVELRPPFNWLSPPPDPVRDFLTARGYALVRLDVRGTGASFGQWRLPWSPSEVADMGEIVDWIIAQPWCDGRVAGFGNSYAGTTAEFLAACGRPAVRAVLPRFNEFDVFTDIGFPGGVPLEGFSRLWSQLNRALDANRHPPDTPWLQRLMVRGVRPVDEDRQRRLLQQAIAEHYDNLHVDELLSAIDSRDQPGLPGAPTLDEINICRHLEKIASSPTRIESHGGWFDAATADAVIRRFLNYPNLRRGLIGPWNHGGTQHASPFFHGANPFHLRYHLDALLHFLEENLAEDASQRHLEYYTIGEEAWKSTTEWPPQGYSLFRLYLAGGGRLVSDPPQENAEPDVYPVDFSVSTGPHNRWLTEMDGRTVHYGDRSQVDRRLLAYTGEPLPVDIEVTGYPIVRIFLSSTHTDGAVFAYLETVNPTGKVLYLTEGQLRFLHRRLSPTKAPYLTPTPYRSFESADRCPMVPGEMVELVFAMQPISVRLSRGHALRVAIAGADAGTFSRIPDSGAPVYQIGHSSETSSHIELPVRFL